jgi:hypothetical protein
MLLLAISSLILMLFLVSGAGADVRKNLAISRQQIAAERKQKEELAAKEVLSRAAEEQAIIDKFDKGIREIFSPPPRLLLSHFKVQQFLREKTNRN